MTNKIYIIPGWGETINQPAYRYLINSVRGVFDCVQVSVPTLEDVSFSEAVSLAKKQIKLSAGDWVLGHSYGATIVNQLPIPKNQKILCSMATFLEDDLKQYKLKDRRALFTAKQEQELSKRKYKTGGFVLFGDKEHPVLINRSLKTNKKARAIKNQGHRLNKKYVSEIKEIIL